MLMLLYDSVHLSVNGDRFWAVGCSGLR